MEEYNFNSDNDYVPVSSEQNEENITPPSNEETVEKIILDGNNKQKPKKKGSLGRFFSVLGTLLLISALSIAGGMLSAHITVEKRLDSLDDFYSKKYAEIHAPALTAETTIEMDEPVIDPITTDEDSNEITLPDTTAPDHSKAVESIENSQKDASATIEQLATIINKQTATSPYATIAAAVKDSVVEITTEMVSNNIFFQQFVQSGAGSGVIISEDGYIITNNHVISGATKVTVRLTSGEEFGAEIVGADSLSDIAILKISANGKLPFAKIGDSSKITVGEEVLAIGNPLGELGGSVTNGIISALDRELTIDGQTMRLLQTNAAINPGNSGGGLFNMKGELIAVVNAKSSGTGIEGLGFAIPINYAYNIAVELLKNGYVSGRPAIGISFLEVNDIMDVYSYGISVYGIYVYDGGKTSLKYGDRIVAFGEYEVSDAATLKNAIQHYKVGDTVEARVVRNNKYTEVEVTLIESKPTVENEPKLEIQ